MNRPIEETVRLLETLVENQEKALNIAKEIMSSKDKLIKLCEEETDLYRKDNKRLKILLMACSSLLLLNAIIHLINLFC